MFSFAGTAQGAGAGGRSGAAGFPVHGSLMDISILCSCFNCRSTLFVIVIMLAGWLCRAIASFRV